MTVKISKKTTDIYCSECIVNSMCSRDITKCDILKNQIIDIMSKLIFDGKKVNSLTLGRKKND